MRLALLVGVVLCVAGLAVAAPQLATDDPPVSDPFEEASDGTDFGPVEGSYFRAMSYDRYTGTGWERTANADPVAALGPPKTPADRIRVRYEVKAPVRTVPAPWRPTGYEGPDAVAVDGSLEPVEPYEPNEEFTVTARRPAAPRSKLRTAGTDYPAGIDRYRRLPEDTPAELDALAADVTAGAETPYGKSVAVNRWLRTEKNYSLSVDRPADHVATAFATEMDAGFCEYFATTMVAMLRAEGVPARYVTGYTPYERVGADEYVVRGKYAHTWVEVYFPDVGWVAFDPTPSASRRAQRGVATVDRDPQGSTALRSAATTERRQDTEPGGWRQLEADIEVAGDLVAGATMTVRVRDPDDGTPIQGAQVRFNGRPVGKTDADGRVRAKVPFRGTLTVAAYVYEGEGEPPPVVGDEVAGIGEDGTAPDSVRDLRYAAPRTEISGSLVGLSDEVLFRATVEAGVLRRGPPASAGTGEAALQWRRQRGRRVATLGTERTFRVNTTVDVTVTPDSGGEGAERPGEPLAVEATIEGRPVPNATVTTGNRTATTDANGTATIPAPYERPAVVTVERGDARGEAPVLVRGDLTVTAGEAAVAGQRVRVTARLEDGSPVPNATVTNGVETATTDEDGVARIPAPYRSPGTVAAVRGDFRDSARVTVDTGPGNLTVASAVPGPGRSLGATFRGVPVRKATVRADGARVAETGRFGRATVAVPYAESVTYTVERGDVTARRTVDVETSAAVVTDGPAIPGGSVDLRATVGGGPLPGATVLVDGRAVAETDADGEATVGVPVSTPTVEIRVRRGAVAATTDLGAVPVAWSAALVVAVAAALLARRRGALPVLRRDPRAVPGAVVGRARALLASLRADVAETLEARDAAATPTPEPDASAPGPAPPPDAPAGDNDVYRAWAAFVAGVDGDPDTPAAVADRAVEAGLPEAAVADLTRTFRAVRYGGADPTPERERRARRALERIREADE